MHQTNGQIYLDGEPIDFASLRHEIITTHDTEVSLSNLRNIVRVTAQENLFSPVKNYLEGCYSAHPDLNYRHIFNELLINEIMHLEVGSIEATHVLRTLVAAVKRVFEPGTQHDTVLVLHGKQGLGKTSFFRELGGAEYMSTSTLSHTRDATLAYHSKWIIEIGEIEQAINTNAKLTQFKEFVSRTEDVLRKPYDSSARTYSRSFVCVGTTNQNTLLIDETGNRRFWMTHIRERINIDLLRAYRDRIWAAAVHASQDGYLTYLDESEQEESSQVAEQYQCEDPWTEPITSWVADTAEPFTLSNLTEKVFGQNAKSQSRKDYARISQILESLGFEKPTKTTRVNGTPGKYYYPPTKPKDTLNEA